VCVMQYSDRLSGGDLYFRRSIESIDVVSMYGAEDSFLCFPPCSNVVWRLYFCVAFLSSTHGTDLGTSGPQWWWGGCGHGSSFVQVLRFAFCVLRRGVEPSLLQRAQVFGRLL